jgi:hypothetical protein
MSGFTRRTFLAGSAVAAAPFPSAVAQPAHKRNLLTTAWTPEKIASVLIPRERFHPYPTAADRTAWEGLPADARSALVAKAQDQLKAPWESFPANVFLEFKRNGNRSHFEAYWRRRRGRLQDLVIGECVERKGRFLDEIVNGVWLTCEESFWGLPAHLSMQKAGPGLPDAAEPIIDLFAAETASMLAWTDYLLGPALAEASKLIPERIRLEADRRILAPGLARDDFGWMGFKGGSPNNWNPWISSNWLTSALLLERDEKRRQAAVHKIFRCVDNFLNGYADDGGCDEGPGYWGRAGASLFDCLELTRLATGGALDGFKQPLVRQIGLYICRAHIHNEWYTNFADAPARVQTEGSLVHRFGKRVGDETMMAHGAWAAFERNASGIPEDSLLRQIPALFDLAELRKARRAQALLRDTWMPGIQVMAARTALDSAKGLYLAAQGGHNAESHNHNDVGNFLVYVNGEPAIIDVGVETYSAKTFSRQRYEIWTMQSAFHNCPTIDGVMQAAGRQFAASEVDYHADDSAAEMRLNLERAYPKEAGLKKWRRTLRLARGRNEITVAEDFELAKPAKTISLTLMTPCKVTAEGDGRLVLAAGSANAVKIAFDAAVFKHAVEEIRIEDGRLRSAWGERLYRILLTAQNPGARGNWTTRITL